MTKQSWMDEYDKEFIFHDGVILRAGRGRGAKSSEMTSFIAQAISNALEEAAVTVETFREGGDLCGKCNLNGKLCRQSYAIRRHNAGITEATNVIRALKEV